MAGMMAGKVLKIKTRFKRTHLIDVLRKNLAEHLEEYKTAMEVYEVDKIEALKNLSKVASKVAKGTMKASDDRYVTGDVIGVAYYEYSNLSKPIDASQMYEEVIVLFENASEEEIELTFEEANTILNNSWDWAVNAKLLNSTYAIRSNSIKF